MPPAAHAVIILSRAYDDQYRETRDDNPVICTSAGKRTVLYQAIEAAIGEPIVLLSPQPRGRGIAKPLLETTSRFGAQTQLFSKASSVRKIRFLLDIAHYARHVAKHTSTGDTLVIDNYELIYIIAVYYCRLLGRRNRILLEYEDGKHLIDKGIWKWMSSLAEFLTKSLVEGSMLATPNLGKRLPTSIPKVVIPGILRDGIVPNPPPMSGEPVGFLYSGSLDKERGIPLLLDYLEYGNFPVDTVFHITGQGHFVDRFEALQARHPGVIHFHGSVSQKELQRIRGLSHYGLNLQSSQNPISEVTYPSKTFDYLNAGIRVISTRAAGVEEVLGETAIYLQHETPSALAEAIQTAVISLKTKDQTHQVHPLRRYSFAGTVDRIREMFIHAGLLELSVNEKTTIQ
jgi:glycosyltransferase involved in cell wall biosynthesis